MTGYQCGGEVVGKSVLEWCADGQPSEHHRQDVGGLLVDDDPAPSPGQGSGGGDQIVVQ
jgi:hypothetical protein